MMLQICFGHLFHHLPHRGTEVSARPKMPAPIAFLQMGNPVKQVTCRVRPLIRLIIPPDAKFGDAPAKICTGVFADNPSVYANLKRFTRLSCPIPHPFGNFAFQNLITTLRHPYKVILFGKPDGFRIYSPWHTPMCHYRG